LFLSALAWCVSGLILLLLEKPDCKDKKSFTEGFVTNYFGRCQNQPAIALNFTRVNLEVSRMDIPIFCYQEFFCTSVNPLPVAIMAPLQ